MNWRLETFNRLTKRYGNLSRKNAINKAIDKNISLLNLFYILDVNDAKQGDDEGFLYVIRNPLNNLYKIGISKHYSKRTRNISTISGIPFEEILVIRANAEIDSNIALVERCIHYFFFKKRIAGEWFALKKCDLYYILNFAYRIDLEEYSNYINTITHDSRK